MAKRLSLLLIPALVILITALFPAEASAREFEVMSFRELPNDVSAFINPVRDLNDEDCALLKVVAPADFVFSTPLGIVKRIDKTGEIWLYLPHGSRKITIKHADWGVMRDYEFPERLESHKSYELALQYPKTHQLQQAAEVQPSITIRDTLVVTRVDTLVVRPVTPKTPLEFDISAGFGFGGRASYTFGSLTLTLMRRHGGYIRISSNNLSSYRTEASCDRNGLVDGSERFYSGTTRRRVMMIGGGAAHRVSARIAVFEGLGYADNTLDWQLAPSEGGSFVRNSYFSNKGLTAEAGIQCRIDCLVLSASVLTLKGSEWFGSFGIGFRFGKKIKSPFSISKHL